MTTTKTKCSYADEYLAIVPPRCLGGKICDACHEKWEARDGVVSMMTYNEAIDYWRSRAVVAERQLGEARLMIKSHEKLLATCKEFNLSGDETGVIDGHGYGSE